jgi:hypothetical protein
MLNMLTKLFYYFDSSNYTLLLLHCFFIPGARVILYMRYTVLPVGIQGLNVTTPF